jgi:hypothetical protein
MERIMKNPMHTVFVDSDSFLYLAAFKAEPTTYWLDHGRGKPSDFSTKAEAIAFCIENDLDQTKITKEKNLCSPRQARRFLDEVVSGALGVYHKWYVKHLYDSYNVQYEYSISSTESFRKDIYPKYKGTRPPKPHYYNLLRDTFIETYDPIIVSKMEADDVVAEKHYEMWCKDPNSSCIATLDKDLYNVPGIHYNTQKRAVMNVDKWKAIHTFCTQMLIGDRSDNIVGIKGVGPKTAEKMLCDPIFTTNNFSSPKQYFMEQYNSVIFPAYIKEFGDKAKYQSALNFKLLDVGQIYERLFNFKGINKVLGL